MADQIEKIDEVGNAAKSPAAGQSYVRELAPHGKASRTKPSTKGFRVPLPDALVTKPVARAIARPVVPLVIKSPPAVPAAVGPRVVGIATQTPPYPNTEADADVGPLTPPADDVGDPIAQQAEGLPQNDQQAEGLPQDDQQAEGLPQDELPLAELITLVKEGDNPQRDGDSAPQRSREEDTEAILVEPLTGGLARPTASTLIQVDVSPSGTKRETAQVSVLAASSELTPVRGGRGARPWVAMSAFIVGALAAASIFRTTGQDVGEPAAQVRQGVDVSHLSARDVAAPDTPTAASSAEALPAAELPGAESVALASTDSAEDEVASNTQGIAQAEQAPSAAPSDTTPVRKKAVNFEDLPSESSKKTPAPRKEKSSAKTASSPVSKAKRHGKATGKSSLSINSIPISQVFVDGKRVGSTPRKGLSVSPGRHNVLFVHPKHGRRVITVDLKPGQRRVVTTKF